MRCNLFQILFLPLMLNAGQYTPGHIAVFGNYLTKEHVILREIEMKSGDSLSDSWLIRERAWLIRSDFLKKIDFQIKPGPDPRVRDLLIVVQEKGHWSFLPSFHTNDLFGIYGGGTLKYRNLNGLRQNIQLKAETGGKNRLNLTYTNPWITRSPHLFTELEFFISDMPYPYSDYSERFSVTALGFDSRTGKQFGRHLRVGFHGAAEKIEAGLQPVMLSGSPADRLFTAGLFIHIDTRDWPVYPRQGMLISMGADHTWIMDASRYQYACLNIKGYFPKKTSDIIAVQLLMQGYNRELPVYKRIHLGGGDTVRGIPTGDLAGDRLIMANVEYRFPILYERNFEENLHVGYAGVLFFDIGSAWFSDKIWNRHRLCSAAGFGVHAIWDDYVIRGEYGFRGKGWGFINIGTSVHF